MAKNNSFIRLEGTLDGLTFYQKDGSNFVKTKSGVSKSRIANDPNFIRTRENNQEFGGAAKVSKAFRQAFSEVAKLMGETYLASRLTALMKRIVTNGIGNRGQRSIDIVGNSDLLEGFVFDRKTPLSAQFFPHYDAPSLNANRDVTTWVIPDFDTDSFIKPPEGATHFKLVLATGLLSNYAWDRNLRSYEADNEDENAIGGTAYSAGIPLEGMVGSDTTLTVDLALGIAVPATTAAMAAIGIVFYQEVTGDLYELASGNAMELVLVS
ncbi:hypothetical protein [Rasiella sp. SM2506]|uniref:hypothetical protein n=1 Tax=Rasiella sp. SM2506 TaxID=3423914 RepID=UPI003D7B7C9F